MLGYSAGKFVNYEYVYRFPLQLKDSFSLIAMFDGHLYLVNLKAVGPGGGGSVPILQLTHN